MTDTRFIILGVGLTFAGFIILGVFGQEYATATLESEEFGNCFEYFEDRPPEPVECEKKVTDKIVFFGLVMGLVGAGIFFLIKGARGRWDQEVKPEDMLGPGGGNTGPDTSQDPKEE